MQRGLLSIIALLPVIAVAQSGQNNWGVRVGVSRFINSDMQDYLGNSKFTFGVTPISVARPGDWKIATDIDFDFANENGNRLALIPLTVGVMKRFGNNPDSAPYVAIRGGIAYADYSITDRFAVRRSHRGFLPTANAEVGLVLRENIKVAVRYDWFGRRDDFTFDSVQLNLSVGLFKF